MTPTTANPTTLDPVLLSDPRIAAIPVVERDEDLVRVTPSRCLSVADAIPVPPADGVTQPTRRVHDLLRCDVARRPPSKTRVARDSDGTLPASRFQEAVLIRKSPPRSPTINAE